MLHDDEDSAEHVPVSHRQRDGYWLRKPEAFFNTCHSFNQTQASISRVRAAIGMNRDERDLPALFFAKQFYSAIGFGHSLHGALDQAKALITMEFPGKEAMPEGYEQDERSLILVIRPPEL
ncbi:hypothetical protein [Pseudomonas sp. NBRC 111134]|uniref:hypothetical protein n=1 Tax=Pseudomonas sp. NBRC 111134 TaxID=1661049 RepID=UPI000A5FACDB|nr:hypothetical protein [Pseudomonas sp. NBRC 111134]